MLMKRLSVLAFKSNSNESAIEKFETRSSAMMGYLEEAKIQIQDPSRSKIIADVTDEIVEYKDTFYEVNNLYKDRNKVLEESMSEAKDTVELSNPTDNALSSICSVIDEIADMNSQISIAVEEQSTVVKEVTINISSISSALNDTIAKSQLAQKTSLEVKQIATELTQLAGGFKV